MPDKVYIKYDGVDAFYPQPTPFVAINEEVIYVNEMWGRAEAVTLQGQLTGCTFDDLVDAQNNLVSRFSKPYQTLEIYQQTGTVSIKVFEKHLVEINSINFDQSRWVGVLPYSVSLTCYPSGLFSGAFGILNPADNWSFTEQQNASLEAVHTISCQPFNTSSGPSNALNNARNWAFGRTGLSSLVAPIFISGVSSDNFCLLTQQETIDRFNGTYSLVENYTNDLTRTGYGVIRYSSDIASGANGITVTLNGNAQGCNRNITGLRYAVSLINWTAVARNQYNYAFNKDDLNPIPLVQSYEEDPFTTQINFSYSYDNSHLPEVMFDYTVDCSVGTNGFITASINGTITARGGDTLSKLNRCKAYASGVNLYDLVLPFYNNFDVSSITPLNPIATPKSQTNHETDGSVDLSATFNNRPQTSSSLISFNANISKVPSITQIDAQPKLDGLGNYSVVSLNYGSRSTFTVNGSAVISRDASPQAGIDEIKQRGYQLFQTYANAYGYLLQNNITTARTDERIVSFSFVWSCTENNQNPTAVVF